MSINGSTVAMSVVLPMVMAVLLICWSKRGGMAWAFVMTFVLGGLASFVLAVGINRVVVPIETLLAGDPASIRSGLAGSFLSAAFSEELARLLTLILSIAVLGRSVGREVIVTCGMIGLTVPHLLHGLYDFASFLFEVIEFPVLPDEPSDADWKLLVPPLATVVLVTAVGLVELIWGGYLVYQLRRTTGGQA